MRRTIGALVLVTCACWGLGPAPAEAQTFIRGDANGNGQVDIADSIFILTYVTNGPNIPAILDSADVNDNGEVELTDAVFHLLAIFTGSVTIPAPFPTPGTDTTPSSFPISTTGLVEFRVGDVDGCPGGQTIVPLFVTNQLTIEALNFRLVHNPAELTFADANANPLSVVLGDNPDFFDAVIPFPGVVQISTLFSFLSPSGEGVPPAIDQRLVDVVYAVDAAVAPSQVVPISLEDDPTAVPPQYNLASINGQVELAVLTNGSITADCNLVEFRRGDANEDGAISISDAVFIVQYLFLGGPQSQCPRTNDTTGDSFVDIGDAVTLLTRLFDNGPPLPAPYPGCGFDPAVSSIDCTVYPGNCP